MKYTFKLYELKRMDKSDRIGIVADDGTFIAARQTDKLDIFLYDYRGVCFFELISDRIDNTIFKSRIISKDNKTCFALYSNFLELDSLGKISNKINCEDGEPE